MRKRYKVSYIFFFFARKVLLLVSNRWVASLSTSVCICQVFFFFVNLALELIETRVSHEGDTLCFLPWVMWARLLAIKRYKERNNLWASILTSRTIFYSNNIQRLILFFHGMIFFSTENLLPSLRRSKRMSWRYSAIDVPKHLKCHSEGEFK